MEVRDAPPPAGTGRLAPPSPGMPGRGGDRLVAQFRPSGSSRTTAGFDHTASLRRSPGRSKRLLSTSQPSADGRGDDVVDRRVDVDVVPDRAVTDPGLESLPDGSGYPLYRGEDAIPSACEVRRGSTRWRARHPDRRPHLSARAHGPRTLPARQGSNVRVVDRLLMSGGTAKRWINGYVRNGRPYEPIVRPEPVWTAWVTWGEFLETRRAVPLHRAALRRSTAPAPVGAVQRTPLPAR